ncbi:ABC transporter permease (plasmid) [Legionella adelaidensis]|uniref:ABC transporter permease n=1 Tax=Legionella adelaidensis TaxID=45056 RepID=A0A0W0R4L5_9GAMM|nr:ABC transporter permease [Legionella adelaidensis]KTC65995.1 ABC transporter permease [Legionella adelaidensis]VEH86319.1 ABC transporter permease [Legionella adelaidensis]
MNIGFLWTDRFFLLVLLIAFTLIIKSFNKEHNRRAFQAIFRKPIAVSSAIILLCFLAIGVLDSIHIKNKQGEIAASLLDCLLSPLDEQYENTYSAPLALHSFSTEAVIKEGTVEQVYPRLQYPDKRLQSSAAVRIFLLHTIIKVFILSVFLTVLVWLLHVFSFKIRKSIFVFRPSAGALSALITFGMILFILLSCYFISRELHLFGTGKIGQDIFYQTVKSIRTGLVIGILTTLFMMPLALLLGIAAGYFGGIVDDIIQYIYTTLSSIPGVLLITASVLSMQTYIANHPDQFTTLTQSADARLLALCIILGVTSWTSLCRLLRAETLKLREIDFILAAKALGSRSFKIIFKHLLPNVMHIVVITVVLDFSFLVLAEAVLSYVGVGVSPLTISWGNMINAARLELAREPIVWWPMTAAFIFMFILVLASNLFADAVRDAFDPRHVG